MDTLPPASELPAVVSPSTAGSGFVYDKSANVAGGPAKVNYAHLDMIDYLIAHPRAKQNEVAERYGYTVPWVSRIINSDAFREMFEARRKEIVDPEILVQTEDRLRALADAALEKLEEKMRVSQPTDVLLKIAEVTLKARGFGLRTPVQVNVQNNSYVALLPEKAGSSSEFAARFSQSPPVDVQVTDPSAPGR